MTFSIPLVEGVRCAQMSLTGMLKHVEVTVERYKNDKYKAVSAYLQSIVPYLSTPCYDRRRGIWGRYEIDCRNSS
jgi:hypothetical protein